MEVEGRVQVVVGKDCTVEQLLSTLPTTGSFNQAFKDEYRGLAQGLGVELDKGSLRWMELKLKKGTVDLRTAFEGLLKEWVTMRTEDGDGKLNLEELVRAVESVGGLVELTEKLKKKLKDIQDEKAKYDQDFPELQLGSVDSGDEGSEGETDELSLLEILSLHNRAWGFYSTLKLNYVSIAEKLCVPVVEGALGKVDQFWKYYRTGRIGGECAWSALLGAWMELGGGRAPVEELIEALDSVDMKAGAEVLRMAFIPGYRGQAGSLEDLVKEDVDPDPDFELEDAPVKASQGSSHGPINWQQVRQEDTGNENEIKDCRNANESLKEKEIMAPSKGQVTERINEGREQFSEEILPENRMELEACDEEAAEVEVVEMEVGASDFVTLSKDNDSAGAGAGGPMDAERASGTVGEDVEMGIVIASVRSLRSGSGRHNSRSSPAIIRKTKVVVEPKNTANLSPTRRPTLQLVVPQPEADPSQEKKQNRLTPSLDHVTILGGEPTMYQCNHCNAKFETDTSIRNHRFCQSKKKPFTCETCGRGCVSRSVYENHLRTHTGEKSWACPECGKGFSLKGQVKEHMKTHTGEKPFVCGKCHQGFAQLNALTQHTHIHTGEKPFACGQCDMRFRQRSNLRTHLRIHTGERPFDCTICGEKFRHKNTMERHLLKHSREQQRYRCHHCAKTFCNNASLQSHLEVRLCLVGA